MKNRNKKPHKQNAEQLQLQKANNSKLGNLIADIKEKQRGSRKERILPGG